MHSTGPKNSLSHSTRSRIAAALLAAVISMPSIAAPDSGVNLSPEGWPESEFEQAMKLNQSDQSQPGKASRAKRPGGAPFAEGANGVVTGTHEALAIRAGLEALRQGGTAMDAALVTAMTQIVLAAGSYVSFAGILTLIYFDAASGTVSSMNAAYNTPTEERDPLSIPGSINLSDPYKASTPSGRTALVPGFFAGVQASHRRFGKLPFETLFGPPIYFAQNGFPIPKSLARAMSLRQKVLTRLPEARRVFAKKDGALYREGDRFKQPTLAETLKRIASEGTDYVYKGAWAKRFVESVRREGGQIMLKDMHDYEVLWQEPLRSQYRNYEIHAPAFPAVGGLNIIEAMNLLQASDLSRQYGHFIKSPEALFWLIQISHLYGMSSVTKEQLASFIPGRDLSHASRAKRSTSNWLWQQMQQGKFPFTKTPSPQGSNHSAAVVAVDRWGNIASLVHTINTVMWGSTGIFVDGISIPDSAVFQQQLIQLTGPGRRLPDSTNPLLVFRDGKPYLGSSSMGAGLHERTLQALVNILDFGMDPKEANDAPLFGRLDLKSGAMLVVQGEFEKKLLDAVRKMGQPLKVVPQKEQGIAQGYWIGVIIDPDTGLRRGASPRTTNGWALGY